MRRARSSQRGGFTMIEMAFVVMILGILASIAVPTYRSSLIRADAAELSSRLNTAELGVREFEAISGRIPTDRSSPGTAPPGLADFVPEGLFRTAFGVTMQYVVLNGAVLGSEGSVAGVYLGSEDARGAEVLDALTHLYPHPVLRMSGGLLVPFGAQIARAGPAAGGPAGGPSPGAGTPSDGVGTSSPGAGTSSASAGTSSTGAGASSTGAGTSPAGTGASAAGSSTSSGGANGGSTGAGSGSVAGTEGDNQLPAACLGSGWLPPGQRRMCATGGGNSAWFRGHGHD